MTHSVNYHRCVEVNCLGEDDELVIGPILQQVFVGEPPSMMIDKKITTVPNEDVLLMDKDRKSVV